MLTKSVLHGVAAAALMLGFASSGAAAKPKPLNAPTGLAVDGQGNLYVANTFSNQILIYGPDFVQQPGATITKGLAGPTGVQFDAAGNLWISNFDQSNGGAAGSIIEYSGGVLQTASTIRKVNHPSSIAFDGNGDLWVQNTGTGTNTIEVFSPTIAFGPPSLLVKTLTPSSGVSSVSVWAGVVTTSQGANSCLGSASAALRGPSNSLFCDYFVSMTSNSVFAPDNAGHMYAATNDAARDVFLYNPDNSFYEFNQITVTATGMAVDNVNQRLYVSSASTSQIFVYSTASANAGQLLTTLHN